MEEVGVKGGHIPSCQQGSIWKREDEREKRRERQKESRRRSMERTGETTEFRFLGRVPRESSMTDRSTGRYLLYVHYDVEVPVLRDQSPDKGHGKVSGLPRRPVRRLRTQTSNQREGVSVFTTRRSKQTSGRQFPV